MNSHEHYIRRCLELAALGLGKIEPGALVGSVIVHNNEIISEGYYKLNGGRHAEIHALNGVQDTSVLPEASLYVSLEPCNHFGKTPPCTEAIISSGIKHVIICNLDSNPKVSGSGIEKLKLAGIEVESGVLKEQGKYVNRRFLHFYQNRRPYVILKWAESKDGFFAPDESKQKWITSEESRTLTHKWRTEEMAILIGKNTALIDNPKLTSRLWTGRQPIRLCIDKNLEIPDTAHIYNKDAPTWILNSVKEVQKDKNKFVKLDFEEDLLSQIMEVLFENSVQSLIVEGGSATLDSFIEENLWDEARILTGPDNWEEGKPSPILEGRLVSTDVIAQDTIKVILNRS